MAFIRKKVKHILYLAFLFVIEIGSFIGTEVCIVISDKPSVKMKTRLTIWLCLPVLVLLIYMIWGIWKVSIKEGEKWKKLANSQQLKSTVVTASRGTIYDAKAMCWRRVPQCTGSSLTPLCSNSSATNVMHASPNLQLP